MPSVGESGLVKVDVDDVTPNLVLRSKSLMTTFLLHSWENSYRLYDLN